MKKILLIVVVLLACNSDTYAPTPAEENKQGLAFKDI